MRAYKLVRKMADGSISPLFINKKFRFPFDEWLQSEFHPTKNFMERQGWHCTLKPIAPHLSEKNRIWIEVEVEDYTTYDRPESQGGTWILADRMKVIRELNFGEVVSINNNLSNITSMVRKKEGNLAALNFYIDYIQPIKEYFNEKKYSKV